MVPNPSQWEVMEIPYFYMYIYIFALNKREYIEIVEEAVGEKAVYIIEECISFHSLLFLLLLLTAFKSLRGPLN